MGRDSSGVTSNSPKWVLVSHSQGWVHSDWATSLQSAGCTFTSNWDSSPFCSTHVRCTHPAPQDTDPIDMQTSGGGTGSSGLLPGLFGTATGDLSTTTQAPQDRWLRECNWVAKSLIAAFAGNSAWPAAGSHFMQLKYYSLLPRPDPKLQASMSVLESRTVPSFTSGFWQQTGLEWHFQTDQDMTTGTRLVF